MSAVTEGEDELSKSEWAQISKLLEKEDKRLQENPPTTDQGRMYQSALQGLASSFTTGTFFPLLTGSPFS